MNEWEEKIWGRVRHAFVSKSAAVSELEVNKGFRCSIHKHAHRLNQFVVTEGAIAVQEFVHTEDGLSTKEMTILRVGDFCIVQPGVWHCFRVIKTGRVIENYWCEDGFPVLLSDIVRSDTGGKDDLFPKMNKENGK